LTSLKQLYSANTETLRINQKTNYLKMNHLVMKQFNTMFRYLLFLTVVIIFSNCAEEAQLWEAKSQEQLAADYINSNPEIFSEFGKLMRETGLESVLNVRGPFTVFAPNDEAMFEYYQMKGVNSLDELDEEFKRNLMLTHIVGAALPTGDFGLGALRETNGLGDYIPTEFEGSEIIVAKYSKVIKRDIRTANGFIHMVDKVLDPVVKDVFNIVSENPSYRILSEGLSITGLKDTLQIIDFPYGQKVARTRFTILAVADTIFNRYGIYNIDDLIDWCGGHKDSVTFITDPFYRFIEYHCLNGSFYLSDLNTGLYPILSRDNNIFITIDDDYKINLDKKTNEYTGFFVPQSNFPAKNGAIHSINDILPVVEPEPATVSFETTDFFDMQQADYFRKYYFRWNKDEDQLAKVSWEGDYLLYYFKINNGNRNNDCLSMNGWWSISITFPKVMKGKYKVSIYQPGWGDVTNCMVYVDGVPMPTIYEGPYGGTGGSGGLQEVGEVEFLTTAEHTVTIRNIVNGMLFWDYVQFDPVR